jgi:hypothetical protein
MYALLSCPLTFNFKVASVNHFKIASASFCLAMCLASNSMGAVTLSFAPTVTNLTSAGGVVTFTLSVDGEAGDVVQAADFYLNAAGPQAVAFSNPVLLAPAGFILTTPPAGASDYALGTITFFPFGPPPIDVSNPTNLFTFDATLAPNLGAVDEVYNFTFDQSNINFGLSSSAGNPLTVSNAFGATVTVAGVTAVPEPSSVALLGLAGCGALVRFRKRFGRKALAA